MQRSLEVLLLFASQKALINVSLTAIGILWHVTDTLGRSRPSAIEAAAAAAAAGDEAAPTADHTCRRDMTDAEVTAQLLRVFTHLRQLSTDPRPEARNSGVRTLFLSVSGQASRFDAAAWRYCLWEILFPLVTYVHVMGDTSSKVGSSWDGSVSCAASCWLDIILLPPALHHSF